MSHSLIFGIDSAGEQKPVSTSTTGEINVASGGSALATATKQDEGNTLLTDIKTNTTQEAGSFSYSKALPVVLTTYEGGASLNVVGSQSGNVKVYIDDANADFVVNSGISTATNQTTTHTKLDTLITTLGDVDLNTDTLETLQTSTNTKLDSVNVNLALQATASNQATTHSKLDAVNTNLSTIDTTLGSQATASNQTTTHTKLDAVNSNLSTIDTTLGSQATASNQATTHTKLDTVNTNLGLLATESTLSTQSGVISSINGKMSQGSDASLTNAQQVLVYGRDSAGGLDALNVDTQGHLKITIQDSEKDTTSATLWSAQTIADLTTANTTAVDMLNHKHIQFYGNTDNTMDNIDIQVSDDNSNWYRLGVFIYPDTNTGDFGYTLNHSAVRYVRLIKSNNSGASETITAKYTMMKF